MHSKRMKAVTAPAGQPKLTSKPKCKFCEEAHKIEKQMIEGPHGLENWSIGHLYESTTGFWQGGSSLADLTGAHIWDYLAHFAAPEFLRDEYVLQDDWHKVAKDLRGSIKTALRTVEHEDQQDQTTAK